MFFEQIASFFDHTLFSEVCCQLIPSRQHKQKSSSHSNFNQKNTQAQQTNTSTFEDNTKLTETTDILVFQRTILKHIITPNKQTQTNKKCKSWIEIILTIIALN